MVIHIQIPIFDALYCEEERFDDGNILQDPEIKEFNEIQQKPFAFFEHDLSWDDDEVSCLLSKERKQARLVCYDVINSDGSLKMLRNDVVKWMLGVIDYYGFSALTAVLAVNCYDRFITFTSLCSQDKPRMSQLAAVACLSIAAKVEETQVPLLSDLQVEECKYLFEAETVQTMELLVLTSLKWEMNPVTPMSYFDYFARRFGTKNNLHWDFIRRCESIILSIITDCSFVHYHPSVIACATMIYVIRDTESGDATEYENQIINLLETSKEQIDDCHKLILEAMDVLSHKSCQKCKYSSIPNSPSGVIDANISSDRSVDSWAVRSSFSSSPEQCFKRKRSRAQDLSIST